VEGVGYDAWSVDWPQINASNISPGRNFTRTEDAAGAPVTGLSGSLTAFHMARAADRRDTPVHEVSPGVYHGALDAGRDGQWVVDASLSRGTESYTARLRANLHTGVR
jgi:hypothetical protein